MDRVNNDIARREAEDVGLKNPEYWSAARSYLERLDNLRSQHSNRPGRARRIPKAGRAGSAKSVPPEPQAVAHGPDRAPHAGCGRFVFPPPRRPPSDFRLDPYTAIMITGLTIPLAYWSRSIVPTILARTRASLPAPARRSKALPRELDA